MWITEGLSMGSLDMETGWREAWPLEKGVSAVRLSASHLATSPAGQPLWAGLPAVVHTELPVPAGTLCA